MSNMKNYLPHLFILILGVSAILFIWSGTTDRLLEKPLPVTSSTASALSSEDGYIEAEMAADDDAATQHQSPLTRSKEDPTRVDGSGFHLSVPLEWKLEGYDGAFQNGEYGNISFGQNVEDAYMSDTAVSINLMTFAQPNDLKKEITNRRMVTADTRSMLVETMQKENPKIGLTEKDILLFDEIQKPLGTYPIYRTGFQCLKTCYIEGSPPIRFSYFIDTGKQIYQFDVGANTSKNTDALIKEAEKIIRSLTLSE